MITVRYQQRIIMNRCKWDFYFMRRLWGAICGKAGY